MGASVHGWRRLFRQSRKAVITIARGLAGAAIFASIAFVQSAFAKPQIGSKEEPVSALGLKVKVFNYSEAVPAITPGRRVCTSVKGGESRKIECYETREIWRMSQRGGEWRSRSGDTLTLARPTALLPSGIGEWAEREKIDAAIKDEEKAFSESAKDRLFAWISDFAGLDVDASSFLKLSSGGAIAVARQVKTDDPHWLAAVFRTRDRKGGLGPWNWVEMRLVDAPASANEGKSLLTDFLRGVSTDRSAEASLASDGGDPRREAAKRAISGGGGWWWSENEDYIFLSNLPKTKGESFIRETQKTMSFLRKAYERYVPASQPVGIGVVRVFANHESYKKYMSASAEGDVISAMNSIGLWSPAREELLVEYLDDKAKTLDTMCHEAFHQYLYYATGGAMHMTWFNEGHATLFENVKCNASSGEVRVLCSGGRADWVAKNPEKVAATIPHIITMSREEYYSGDVNGHYVAGWALCYFLRKGVFATKGLEAYQGVVPAYLKGISEGLPPQEANERAWAIVKERDISSDFLKFWKNRKRADGCEPNFEKPH